MVDMRMGQKKKVQLIGSDRPTVHGCSGIMALAEAAVHHDVQTLYLQQMAGTGDAFFSADVDDVHFDGLDGLERLDRYDRYDGYDG